MKRKTILGDFALNLLASLVTTGVAQLLVYPLLSSMYSAEEYGIILTVMGITNTGIVTIGGSLNNVRLMVNADYEAENQRGDFLPILWGLSLVTALLFAAYLSKFYAFGYALVAALVLFLIAGILRSYGTVSFRLVINYKVNLICSCAVAVGNVLGILLLRIPRFEDIWALPFLLGEVMGVLVILDRSRILCEPIRKTLFFKSTCRKEAILLSTTLSANILTYLDRLLLLPLLGGEAVAKGACGSHDNGGRRLF